MEACRECSMRIWSWRLPPIAALWGDECAPFSAGHWRPSRFLRSSRCAMNQGLQMTITVDTDEILGNRFTEPSVSVMSNAAAHFGTASSRPFSTPRWDGQSRMDAGTDQVELAVFKSGGLDAVGSSFDRPSVQRARCQSSDPSGQTRWHDVRPMQPARPRRCNLRTRAAHKSTRRVRWADSDRYAVAPECWSSRRPR